MFCRGKKGKTLSYHNQLEMHCREKKKGKAILLVIGGAAESLDARQDVVVSWEKSYSEAKNVMCLRWT